jgi:hypothetical protein
MRARIGAGERKEISRRISHPIIHPDKLSPLYLRMFLLPG